MKHKNTSSQSNELLSYFFNKQQACFEYKEALKIFPLAKENTVFKLLSDMTKRGLLMRVKEGIYYIIPFEENPETFMPDWHLLAKYLVGAANFYIGYYSALQIHHQITQPSLKEQIVVDQQIRPSAINIKGIHFQFIYHNQNHFFGGKNTWIDDFNKVVCSDWEKTIIDCLFKPDYAGGIVEIAQAIFRTKDAIDFKKLLNYTIKFKSQAVIKRLGFVLESFEINHDILKELQKLRTDAYVLLDTELPKTGKRISRWRIQQNLDIETIKSAFFS